MTEKKITKREKFEMIAKIEEVAKNPILAKFVENELELLAKKNSANRGLTSTQKENEGIKSAILIAMGEEPDRLFSITEMIKNFECCKDLSLPKVTALVSQLVKAEEVERLEEKRKAYFRIAR